MNDFLIFRRVTTRDCPTEGIILSVIPDTDQVMIARPQDASYSVTAEHLSNIVFPPVSPASQNTSVGNNPYAFAKERNTSVCDDNGNTYSDVMHSPEYKLTPLSNITDNTRYRVRQEALEKIKHRHHISSDKDLYELLQISGVTFWNIVKKNTQPRLNVIIHMMRLLDTANIWDVVEEGGNTILEARQMNSASDDNDGDSETDEPSHENAVKTPRLPIPTPPAAPISPVAATEPSKTSEASSNTPIRAPHIRSDDRLLGRMKEITIPDSDTPTF